MQAWQTLIHTALLGTGKGAGPDAALSDVPELSSAHAALKDRDAETKLLGAIALLYSYRRCGVTPFTEALADEHSPSETLPYCSTEAAGVLSDILLADSAGLLQLWLSYCKAGEVIVPPELITGLLSKGAQQKALRPLIAACCGHRGEWLCGLNSAWGYSTGSTDEERWETGTTAERAAILKAKRAEDAAAGRAMLEAVWPKEKADVKEEFLLTFETGLNAEDIPFLESISSEKSKKVVALAHELLRRLPDSSIVQGFKEILKQAVHLVTEKRLLGMVSKTSLEIELPPETDKRIAEIIGKKPESLKDVSEADFAIAKMLRSVPPDFWEEHLGLPPERILQLFEEASGDNRFIISIRAAAVIFRNIRWARLFRGDRYQFHPGLLQLLDAADQKTYLINGAQSSPKAVMDYYSATNTEWDMAAAPLLLRFAASTPYQYSHAFYNAVAHLLPVAILQDLPAYNPDASGTGNEPMKSYLQQAWDGIRAHIASLLETKTRTLTAFQR